MSTEELKIAIAELKAIIVYLNVVNAVYAIAPEEAILTIRRVIEMLSAAGATGKEPTPHIGGG